MARVRVGIIGTGFGLRVQAPAFRAHPEVELVALASVRSGRAQSAAAAAGIPHADDDYRRMLAAEHLDLVSVASAPYLHYEMTLAALEQGVHVLCEKPIGLTAEQGRAMLAAARAAGRIDAINFEYRLSPGRVRCRELVAAGYLGRLLQLAVTQVVPWYVPLQQRPHGWLAEPELGGGFLGAVGAHLLDTLLWCFGGVATVAASLQTLAPMRSSPEGPRPARAEDSFACLLRLESGATAILQFLQCHHGPGVRIEAYGSEGSLILEERAEGHKLWGGKAGDPLAELPVGPIPPVPDSTLPADATRQMQLVHLLIDRVVARIQGRPAAEFPTFAAGIAVQTVMDAIRRANADRRWVAV